MIMITYSLDFITTTTTWPVVVPDGGGVTSAISMSVMVMGYALVYLWAVDRLGRVRGWWS